MHSRWRGVRAGHDALASEYGTYAIGATRRSAILDIQVTSLSAEECGVRGRVCIVELKCC